MKNKAGLYAKNSVIILVGRASEFIFGIISVILIARYLGAEEFGAFAFIRGIGMVITPIIGYGGNMVLMRELSIHKGRAPTLLSSSLILQTLLSFIVLLTTTVVFAVLSETKTEFVICIYLVIIAQTLLTYYRAVSLVFLANEKVIYDAGISIVIRIVNLLFYIVVIFINLNMIGFFSALILANLTGFLVAGFFLARNFFIPRFTVNTQTILFLFKESWTLIISNVIVHGYMNVGLFLLKAFSSLTQISFYQIPQRLIEPLKMIPRAIVMSVMPAFSLLGSAEETRRELLSLYNKMLKYMMVCLLPVCVGAVIYAGPTISLLFGEEFLGSTIPFQINIWTLIAFFVITMSENVLTVLNKQRVLAVSNGFCFLVVSVLCVFLIPDYAAVGASVAMTGGIYCLLFLDCYFISRYLGRTKLFSTALRPVISGVIMWIFMSSFSDYMHIVLLIPSALAIYIVLLISFKTLTVQEIGMLKTLLRKLLYRFGLIGKGCL